MASKLKRAKVYAWIVAHKDKVGAVLITDWLTDLDYTNIRTNIFRRYRYSKVRLHSRQDEKIKLELTIIPTPTE